MTDRWRTPMEAWARDRGLEFAAEGLLPPWTPALAQGLHAGPRRAALVVNHTTHSVRSVGGFRKWPERSTYDLCTGRLPGGLHGTVAHHIHLAEHSDGEGSSWKAWPKTVVAARLAEGARVVRELRFSDGEWRTEPRDELARVQPLCAAVEAALRGAPEGTRVEYRYGALCVSVDNAIVDPGALDALCRVGAAFAAAMHAAAAAQPELSPAPLPAPAATPRQQWLDEGIARVAWPTPPASAADAEAAYAAAVADEARASGRKVRRIVAGAAAVLGLLVLAITGAVALWFGGVVTAIFFFVVVFGPLFFFKLVRAVGETADEVASDHVTSRAVPWGAEAFARGYAAARGYALEDRDAFRHAFAPPVPGVPVAVLRNEERRLVLWLDQTDLGGARRHFLIGIGERTVVREVDAAGRTAAALDAVAAEAGSLQDALICA